MDDKDRPDAVRTINNRGISAYRIALMFKKTGIEYHDPIEAILKRYAFRDTMKPLNELLVKEKVIADCPEAKTNPRLKRNLELATDIANELRSIPELKSTSHTSANGKEDLQESKAIKKALLEFELVCTVFPAAFGHCLNLEKMIIDKYDEIISKYKWANCSKLAVAALKRLREKAPDLKGEVVRTENGDHTYLVIDRKEGSDIRDFSKWGENAVVCDPWSGEVFSKDQIPSKLKCHDYVDNDNIVYDYNVKFHKLGFAVGLIGEAPDKFTAMKNAAAIGELQCLKKLLSAQDISKSFLNKLLIVAIAHEQYQAMVFLLMRGAEFKNEAHWERAMKIVPETEKDNFQRDFKNPFKPVSQTENAMRFTP